MTVYHGDGGIGWEVGDWVGGWVGVNEVYLFSMTKNAAVDTASVQLMDL